MMPEQKPGKSEQVVETPDDFMDAFINRFGAISWDLAASPDNAKSQNFFTEEQDSLKQDWSYLGKTLWLNPPYEKIEPWAKKCAATMNHGGSHPSIYMLVPASIGSDWFRFFVQPFAVVLALTPRLKFKGHKSCYPKDLILACYVHGLTGFNQWRWKI